MDYTSYISNVSAWKDCCRPDKKINFYFLPLTKWFDFDKEEWHDLHPFRSKGATYAVPNAWLEDLHVQYTDQNGQEKSFVINSEREPYRSWGGVGSDKTMQGRILLSLKPGAYTVTARATLGSQVKRKSEKLTTLSKTISVVVPENGDVIACLIMYELYDYEVDTYLTRYSLKSLKNVELNINKGIIKTRDEHTVTKRDIDCTFSQITASQASGFYEWWRDASSLAKVVVPEGAVGGADVSFANKNDVADSNCRDAQNSEYKPKANAQKTAEELKQERIASLKKSLSNYTTDDLLSGKVAQWEAMYMAETGKYFVRESDYKWTVPDLSEIQPPQSKIVWKNSGYFDVIEPKKPKVKKDKHKIHFTPEELGHVEKEEPKPRAPRKPRSPVSADVVSAPKITLSQKEKNDKNKEESWASEGWECRVDGKYTKVIGCKEPSEKVFIPAGVTSLGKSFFASSARCREVIKEIVLPHTVDYIEPMAFKDCTNLQKIDLSQTGIKEIPDQAFCGCNNLEKLFLPAKIGFIGEDAFAGCNSLPYAILSDEKVLDIKKCGYCADRSKVYRYSYDVQSEKGVALVGEGFDPAGLSNVQSDIDLPPEYQPKPVCLDVSVPNSVKGKFFIGLKGYSRQKITTLTLPGKIKELKSFWFEYCTNLEEVDLSQTSISRISAHCFRGCVRLKKVILPSTVTVIEKEAFAGCVSLESISLKNINDVWDGAFKGCESLEEINMPNATWMRECAFEGCVRLKKAYLPEVGALRRSAFADCHSLKQIDVSNVYNLDGGAFSNCGNLTEVHLPLLKWIYTNAFYGCWAGLRLFIGDRTAPTSIVGVYDNSSGNNVEIKPAKKKK
ncbi:MAG: leucine-rich repeat domain-containing protein [Clostridia bacterium]|nr:leucine-rich repeat domain-containing protein [Clostridia bacterium]